MAPRPRIPGKGHGALSISCIIQKMIVIQHPQGIHSLQPGYAALLPVDPPEINSLLLKGMMQILKISLHKLLVRHVKDNGQTAPRIHPERLSHLFIGILIIADTICRMHIQSHMQPLVMKPGKEGLRIRKKLPVPGITRPAAPVLFPDIHQMPVHIDNRHGKGNFLPGKAFDQLLVAFLCIPVIPAPPVAKCIPGNHGHSAAEPVKILNAGKIIVSIAPEIQILLLTLPPFHPAVPADYQRFAVIHQRIAQHGYQAVLKRNFSVRVIQSPCRSP